MTEKSQVVMKTCRDFCEHLSDYLDGEIGPNECVLIEEHLDICPPCALLFESLKTTVQICGRGVTDEIPADLRENLKQFLRRHCT